MKKPQEKTDGKYTWTITVGSKGQFVIPKEAREVFKITPGTTLLILGDKNRGMVIPKPEAVAEISKKIFGKDDK